MNRDYKHLSIKEIDDAIESLEHEKNSRYGSDKLSKSVQRCVDIRNSEYRSKDLIRRSIANCIECCCYACIEYQMKADKITYKDVDVMTIKSQLKSLLSELLKNRIINRYDEKNSIDAGRSSSGSMSSMYDNVFVNVFYTDTGAEDVHIFMPISMERFK